MKVKLALLGTTALLLLVAGCGGLGPAATATPLPTPTIDAAATAAAEALTADQTALANDQADLASTQQSLAIALEESSGTAVALASAEALLGERQATLDAQDSALFAAQETLSADQAAITTAQVEATAQQATLNVQGDNLAADEEALQATQLAFATIQADVAMQATGAFATAAAERTAAAESAANSLATVEAVSTQSALNDLVAATNSAVIEDLRGTATDLEATATTLAQPTSTPEASPTLPPSPTFVPSPVPTREVAIAALVEHTLDGVGIQILVPEDLGSPLQTAPRAVTFEKTQSSEPETLNIVRLSNADMTDSSGAVVIDPANPDPVAALDAAVADMQATTAIGVTISQPPTLITANLPYPAAQTRIQLEGFSAELDIVLLHLADDDWLLLSYLANPERLDTIYIEGIVRSIVFLDETAAQPSPEAPSVTPSPEPPAGSATAPDSPQDAIGLDFEIPPDWVATAYDSAQTTYPSIEMYASEDTTQPFIGLLRASSSELADVLDFPEGETDPVAILQVLSETVLGNQESQGGFSAGRYNPLTIGNLNGAWTQMRSETDTQRFYLFQLGADDWLFIGALAPRDGFSAFSQNELGGFLNSLAVRASEGVALGLDFTVPTDWVVDPIDEEGQPEGVYLAPPAETPDRRQITMMRGSAADYAAADMGDFSADEIDAVVALQSIADMLMTQSVTEVTGGRVESFQLRDLPGAFASFRAEEATSRVYLFRLGDDDWLLIIASAVPDAFNDMNRNELRTVLADLQLASGSVQLTTEPIGPVEEVTITHISDGDTIYVLLDGVEESVRIIGVDTPEAHHPESGADWLGYAATHYAMRYISEGGTVYLESDERDRDDYDRLLRYVWIKDENDDWVMLEAELIRSGMAHVRTYDETRYVPYFMALEREAQAAGLGVWGDPPPPPPTEPIAEDKQQVWAINPDGDAIPMLYDAAALGNVPEPYGYWPNHITAQVEDVYYVYPDDIDPFTGEPVSEDKVGYWYWLEINDFRGWVPERWILTEEPEWTYDPPDTDIIAYAQPFITGDEPLEALDAPGGETVTGQFEPGERVQVEKLAIDTYTGDWWLYADTQTVDGWLPLSRLSRTPPEE